MVNYYLQRVSLTFRIADAMEVVPRTAELACAALTPTADSNSGLQQRTPTARQIPLEGQQIPPAGSQIPPAAMHSNQALEAISSLGSHYCYQLGSG